MKLVRITLVQYTASSTENSIPITLMGTMLHPFLSDLLTSPVRLPWVVLLERGSNFRRQSHLSSKSFFILEPTDSARICLFCEAVRVAVVRAVISVSLLPSSWALCWTFVDVVQQHADS